MRVGILGSGLMGGKLGTIFARAGHEVGFSYARRKEKLKKLARDAKGKARAATPILRSLVAINISLLRSKNEFSKLHLEFESA